MFRVGRQKTVWLRATSGLGVFLTLTVGVHPAFGWSLFGSSKSKPEPAASAPPPPARPPVPPPPPVEMVRGRVAPTSVRVDAGPSGTAVMANNPWRLFDGDGMVGFMAGTPTRVRATLPAGTVVQGLGAYGASSATLTVFSDEAGTTPMKGLDHVSLADLPLRWNRFEAASPVAAQALVIEIDPAPGAQADVRELEIWGSTPARAPAAPGSIAEALLTGLPPSAVSVPASPNSGEMSYPKLGPDGSTMFRVDLTQEAIAMSRAFLVYNLEGLPHWSAARRRINGLTVAGGAHAHRAAGGLQVEEISPSWLRAGTNEIQFLAANPNDPLGYKVKDLRVVVIPAAGDAPAYAQAGGDVRALVDGRRQTGVTAKEIGDGMVVDLRFPTPSQPDSLLVATESGDKSGTITIDPVVQGKVQRSRRVTARLQDLQASQGSKDGWSRIPLDAAPTEADGVRVLIQGDDEHPVKGRIAEMRVTGSPRPIGAASTLTVSYPLSGECVDGEAYVIGFLQPDGMGTLAGSQLKVNGQVRSKALGPDGAFSAIVPSPPAASRAKKWRVDLEADFSNGDVVQKTVNIEGCRPPEVAKAPTGPIEDQGAPYGQWVHPGQPATVSFAGATLEIPAGAVTEDTRITVRPLDDAAVPATDDTLTNVTPGGRAYRFGPHGLKFAKAVNLTIPYDRSRFPSGMSEEDLGTFYFDETVGKWHQVQTLKGNANTLAMTAETTHFTDFITATLASPDHPAADSFNPNLIKDMKAPDPAAMIDVIQPPAGSPDGAAHLSYPLWVPPGRQGMQPDLSVNYNSSGGNGLLGLGWELSLSSIEVDTRFGVPTYNPNSETETYSLDGELLVPDPNQPARSGARTFHRRAEGKFDKIIRTGAGPVEGGVSGTGQSTAGYNWEVVTVHGMHYFYGSDFGTRGSLVGSGAYRWYLDHVEDAFGNQVVYSYHKGTPPFHPNNGPGASADAVEIYPQSILYTTDSNGQNGFYRIDFELNGDGISTQPGDLAARPDPSSNARGGTIALMGRRLVNIRVFQSSQPNCTPGCSNSSYIRRYNFLYQTGAFGKSLLSQIRVCIGEDGFRDSGQPPAEFYHHTFTYSTLPTNASTGRPGFGATQSWGSVSNGGPGFANEISGNLDGTLMGGWGPGGCALFHGIVGVSSSLDLPIPSPAFLATQLITGVSPPNNDATTVRGFVDVNGDGLPDFVGLGGTFLNGGDAALGAPSPTSFVSKTFKAPPNIQHANNFSISLQGGAHELYETAHQTVEHVWASSHDDQILADIDGDGFVDYLSPNSFILNKGSGFNTNAAWSLLPAGQSFMPASILQEQKDKFTLTDPTLRWTAPFSGHVSISGAVQKAPNTQPGSDGVVVLVQSYTTNLLGQSQLSSQWSQKLTDPTPCGPVAAPTPPSTPTTGCGSGRTIFVKTGDRVYFRADSIDSIDDDAVTWDPVISYQDLTDDSGNNLQTVSAAQHLLQEPFNTGAYDFNQTNDFRLAGKPASLWRDDSAGAPGDTQNMVSIEITGTIVKPITTDAVTFQILKFPAGVNPPTAPTDITPTGLANLPANQPQTINVDLHTTTVPGDRIFFQTSSATPIDPNQVKWSVGPQVEYRSYCRTATVSPTQALEVSPTETTFCGTLSPACDSGGQCQIQNDPDPANNIISTDVVTQKIAPYYQLPPWAQRGAPAGFVPQTAGTISFTSTTTGPAGARLMVRAIDAQQNASTLLEGVSGAVARGGTTAVGPATTTPINVTAGQSIIFDVFANETGSITDSSSWTVTLQFSGQSGSQQFVARRNYQLPTDVAGSGEFHDWGVIEWNGSQNTDPTFFSESLVNQALTQGLGLTDSTNSNATAPVHMMVESPRGLPAGPNGVPAAVTVPVWRGSGADGYIAAGGLKPSRLGKPGTDSGFVFSSTSNDSTVTSVGFILSGTTSDSTSQTQAMLLDLNGDRYPDLVTNSGVRFNHITNPGQFIQGVTESGTFDQNQTPFDLGGGDLRDIAGHQVAGTLGISSPVALYTEGHPPAWASALPTLGIGYGHAVTTSELIDLNGDGLPDYVTLQAGNALTVRYNLGGTFSPAATYPAPTWETSGTAVQNPNFLANGLFASPDLFGSPNSDARSDVLQFQDNAYNNIGAGYSYIGVNHTASVSRTQVDLIDINGDGLPDMVWHQPKSSTISIKFNQGDSFGTEVQWDMPGWSLPSGEGLEQDLTVGLGSNDALAFTESDGFGASAGNAFYIETFTPAGCFVIEVGAGGGESSTGSEMRFEDIDGDGAPDQVLRLANPILNVGSGDSNVYVRRNPAAGDQNTGVNLLQTITTPLGGTINLSYERIGHVVDTTHGIDMPEHVDALHQVFLDDQMPDVHNQMTWVMDYSDPTTGEPSGFHSRDEREFFGFAHVRTSDGPIQIDRTYDTSTYARRHLLLNEVTSNFGANTTLFRQVANTYQDRTVVAAVTGVSRDSTFPALIAKTTSFYEGLTNNLNAPVKTTQQTFDYNNFGQVSTMSDFDDVGTADDVHHTVNYSFIPDPLGSGATIVKPSQVLTQDGNGNSLRNRQATYEPHGALQTFTEFLFGGKNPQGNVYPISNTNPTSSFTYDAFGNLQTATDPTGYSLTYVYNTESNTFIHTITDSFGYSSTRTYNLNFGAVAMTTDVNEASQEIDYDTYGRIRQVFAPQDFGTTSPTVNYQYAIMRDSGGTVGTEPFWAMTKTKDLARQGSTLDVVDFRDGFGRDRQTKKTATVSGVDGMIISGKIGFDTQGRVFDEGFPFSETGLATETTYNRTPVGRASKTYAYDVLNRVRAVSTPDDKGPGKDLNGNPWVTTLIDYNVKTLDGVQRLTKTTQDPQQKLRTEFVSPRGEVLGVNEMNRVGTAFPNGQQTVLTTRYTYDSLSELVQVQDASGNVTTATYDSLGNIVKLVSPDAGQTEWRHYSNGLLAAKETANLRAKSQLVNYSYDVNRLTNITYPLISSKPNPENVIYTYGKVGAANGVAGRIATVTDESGTETRSYDQLGNVNQMQKAMIPQSTSIPTVTYTMSYNYDPLGRVLNMTYPDNEQVTYTYDAGGKPTQVSGKRNGTTTNYVNSIQYNALDQRSEFAWGNGVTSIYTYYPDTRRLDTVNTGSPSLGKAFQKLAYFYDVVGNLTQVANAIDVPTPVPPNTVIAPGPDVQNFVYDDLYQLTSATGSYQGCACGCGNSRLYTLTNQYDGIGNILQKTQNDTIVQPSGTSTPQAATTYNNTYQYKTAGRPHAPSNIGTESISYDNDGNMQGTNGTFGPSRAFTWTEDDRLRTETDSGFTNSYLYDAAGNRAEKRRTSIETWYVNPFYVVKGYTTETKHIMVGDARVASEMATISTFTKPSTAGSGTVFYYQPDHLQSTQFTTAADGSLLQHDEYIASGEVWFQESKNNDPRNTQPWLYDAKELDETGLYYFGARYYNPKYSQWANPDPILASYMRRGAAGASPANLGLFSYSYNNPIVLKDPDGMAPAFWTNSLGERCVDAYCDSGNGGVYNSRVISSVGEGMAEPAMHPKLGFAYLAAEGGQMAALGFAPGGVIALRFLAMMAAVQYASACQGGDQEACGKAFLAIGMMSYPESAEGEGLASGAGGARAGAGRMSQFLRNKLGHIKNQMRSETQLDTGVLGSVTGEQAETLADAFLGPGSTPTSNGYAKLSADRLRMVKGPATKGGINPVTNEPYTKTGYVMNFSERADPSADFVHNVHLDVKK